MKTYQQPDAREAEQFWSKIWQPREHNEKAEWIKQHVKRLRTRRRTESGNIHRFTQNNAKNIKSENTRPWWNTWILVQEIHLYSRQTSSQNEQMPTRNTCTWMDDQRKYHFFQKDPLNGTTNNYRPITCLPMMGKILMAQIKEEIYYSLKSRRLFHKKQKGCRKRSWDRKATLHWSTHPQREQDGTEKSSYGLGLTSKTIWYGPTKLNNKLHQNVQDIG